MLIAAFSSALLRFIIHQFDAAYHIYSVREIVSCVIVSAVIIIFNKTLKWKGAFSFAAAFSAVYTFVSYFL